MIAANMYGLTKAEHRAIAKARCALAESLEHDVGSEALLPLLISATVAGFVDVVQAAGEAPEIVAFINAEIEGAGLQLVATPRR
jgi:hypothetical protein